MNSKTDDQRQVIVGQPTDKHYVGLTRQELTALLLMERCNTILRAQIACQKVAREHSGTGAERGAQLVYLELRALYDEATTETKAATALAEGRA